MKPQMKPQMNSEVARFVDKIGRDIWPGDFFLYPIQNGIPDFNYGMALGYKALPRNSMNRPLDGKVKLRMIGSRVYESGLMTREGFLEHESRVWKISKNDLPNDILYAFESYYEKFKQGEHK